MDTKTMTDTQFQQAVTGGDPLWWVDKQRANDIAKVLLNGPSLQFGQSVQLTQRELLRVAVECWNAGHLAALHVEHKS